MGIGIHMSEEFKSITQKDKSQLEKKIGEYLPNGLEIGTIYYPASTFGWQSDDEYKTVLRYSRNIAPEDKALCEALVERNLIFRYLLEYI